MTSVYDLLAMPEEERNKAVEEAFRLAQGEEFESFDTFGLSHVYGIDRVDRNSEIYATIGIATTYKNALKIIAKDKCIERKNGWRFKKKSSTKFRFEYIRIFTQTGLAVPRGYEIDKIELDSYLDGRI